VTSFLSQIAGKNERMKAWKLLREVWIIQQHNGKWDDLGGNSFFRSKGTCSIEVHRQVKFLRKKKHVTTA